MRYQQASPKERFSTELCTPIDSTTAAESEQYVKIGGELDGSSDPRKIRGLHLTNGIRIRGLRLIDSKICHYFILSLLFLDFVLEILAILFSTQGANDAHFGTYSNYFSSVVVSISCCDLLVRIFSLRVILLRSNSTIADLLLTVASVGIMVGRYLDLYPTGLVIAHICLLSGRLAVKPRSWKFSLQLHNFTSAGRSHIRISIESVKSSLRRIPGITAVAADMMETDLMIICGRDSGNMSCDELMIFLERALIYRPTDLSTSDFLAHLKDIDAHTVDYIYGAFDVIKSTLSHWSSQKSSMIISLLVVCMNATIFPLQSYLLQIITDNYLVTSTIQYATFGILFLCFPFVLGNCGIGYFQSIMIANATANIQNKLLFTILSHNSKFFMERNEGDLNNLFASDIARINALWQSVFWNLLNPLISVIGGFMFILWQDWTTGVICFAFTFSLLSSGPQSVAAKRSKEFGSKNAYITAEFQNAISCNKLIRAYDIKQPLLHKFDENTMLLKKISFSKDFWASIVQIYVESAMYMFVACITSALALRLAQDDITVGQFVSRVALLGRISTPVATLGGFMRVAIGNASSLQRVDEVLAEGWNTERGGGHPQQSNAASAPPYDRRPELPLIAKSVELRNIFFKYSEDMDEYVLKDLCAVLSVGSMTCVCGPSGCGKSTILNLLMQFEFPNEGKILADGNLIYDYSKESFQRQFAVVFQEILILNGTILDNIRYGKINATDEECIEAAKQAECYNFIMLLSNAFHTVVGQHATCNLSGGQAQRICLARALVRKPRLLLLDEATSALDPETESQIVGTLEKLVKGSSMTIVSVTHRLQTTVNANKIIVVNQGKVVEWGTYKELVALSGSLFREMISTSPNKAQAASSCSVVLGTNQQPFGLQVPGNESESIEKNNNRNNSTLLNLFSRHLSSRVASDHEVRKKRTSTEEGRVSSERNVYAHEDFETQGNESRHSDIIIL